MESLYFDEIHKGGKDPKSLLLKILIVIAAAILCYLCMCFMFVPFIGQFMFLFFCGSIAGAVFLFRRMNKEYEYIFTNGEIDIDVISGRMTRKRACTIKPEHIEIFIKYSDDAYQKYSKMVVKASNYSTGIKDDCYIVVVNINHTKMLIVFSPTERLIEAWKPYIKKLEVLRKINNY